MYRCERRSSVEATPNRTPTVAPRAIPNDPNRSWRRRNDPHRSGRPRADPHPDPHPGPNRIAPGRCEVSSRRPGGSAEPTPASADPESNDQTPADRTLDVLTEREREMVALAAHGLSNEDIAGRLYLSPLTVKTHVNRAMSKLHVRDRAQLVVLAYRTGLVRAGDPEPR